MGFHPAIHWYALLTLPRLQCTGFLDDLDNSRFHSLLFEFIRYFVLLGFLMGLFNIIPIAGGAITITLAALVAALDSWTKMAGVILFYVIYVNIENAILTPRIMRSSVNLMGLTVLVALLLGTALAGVVGALVSVPTAALITVLLDEYAVQKN